MIEPTDEMVREFRRVALADGKGIAEGLAAALILFVRRIEGDRDTGLCDCYDPAENNPPTNPGTGALMDHHCECRAVETAADLLGDASKTVHARQCVCRPESAP